MSDNSNYDAACHGGKPAKMWDPPLLYDLNLDPGERHPVETDSAIYRLGVKIGSNTLIVFCLMNLQLIYVNYIYLTIIEM